MIETFEKEAESVISPRDALTFSHWTVTPEHEFLRIDQQTLDFASWDYFGNGLQPRVIRAAQEELQSSGFGSSIGRRWIGASPATLSCEENLAKFWKINGAILFPGINQAVFSLVLALGHENDLFLVPETTSGPIIDVAALLGCTVVRYRPHEMQKISAPSRQFRRRIIFVDSIDPAGCYVDLTVAAKIADDLGASLFVDDSLGFGIRGNEWLLNLELASQLGVVFCVNFSRRFGIQGAAIGGSQAVLKLISSRSRVLSGEPAFSAPNAAAINAIVTAGFAESELLSLDKVSEEMRLALIAKQIILQPPRRQGPVISIPAKDIRSLHQLWSGLLERGILADRFVSVDPQIPDNYLRLFMHTNHSAADRQKALQALFDVTKIIF